MDFLNYDFCPWANRYVYWVKRPLALLCLAALGAFSLGLFVAPQGLWAGCGIVGLILLGFVWPWLAISRISASMSFSQRRSVEGQTVEAVLRVHNRWPFPAWGLTLSRGFGTPENIDGEQRVHVAVALARVPGWSQAEFRWTFTPDCRGEYPLELPELSTAFPFGLWRCSTPVMVASKLVVWPRIVNAAVPPRAAGASHVIGTLSERKSGTLGDVIGTRPFRPGDSMRHVHWPLTARTGRLVVCERQGLQISAVSVRLDLRRAIHGGTGPDSSLEWAIRIAASVVDSFLLQHHRVHLVIDHRAVATAAHHQSRQNLFDLLARWQDDSDPNDNERLATAGLSEVVITTDLACRQKPPTGRALVIALSASGFAGLPELSDDRPPADVWLTDPSSAAHDFQAQWQRAVRHASSFA